MLKWRLRKSRGDETSTIKIETYFSILLNVTIPTDFVLYIHMNSIPVSADLNIMTLVGHSIRK